MEIIAKSFKAALTRSMVPSRTTTEERKEKDSGSTKGRGGWEGGREGEKDGRKEGKGTSASVRALHVHAKGTWVPYALIHIFIQQKTFRGKEEVQP